MDSIESLARAAGVRGGVDVPQLEDVNRRRAQLWLLLLLTGVALPAVFVVLLLPSEARGFVPATVGVGLVALFLALVGYVLERERALRRLTGLLLGFRTQAAALEARVDELDLLLRASRAMNASLELDAVLGIILTSASELLGAVEGAISLVRADDPDQLEIVATFGASGARRGELVRIGPELAGLVAQVAEPELTPPLAARWDRDGDCVVSVALLHRDELVGVLDLNTRACEPLSDLELRSLSLYAETAAAAITNARLHQASQRSIATLTELDRLKDEFLALVTHELRTPLTSVIGLAQTIERGGERLAQAKVIELARLIGRQGWRLDRLVDDLLRSTEAQRGILALSPEPIDIAAVARETVAGLRATAGDRTISLALPEGPIVRTVDGDAVHRILANLVGNALKYTHSDATVLVSVDGSNPDRVVLVVDDDGPGIPEPEERQVFEKFRRGEGFTSGGGLGLGLYLVRALAVAHGGGATLERSTRGGCRFTVVLGQTDRAAIGAT